MNDIKFDIILDATQAQNALKTVDASAASLAAAAAKIPAAFNNAFKNSAAGSEPLAQNITSARIAVQNMVPQALRYENSVKRMADANTILQAANAKTTNSVTAMQGSLASSNYALTSFGRIVQDAPFGIMAIGNNVTQFAEAFSALKNQTGSTSSALKAFAAGLTGSGGVMMAINLAVTALTYLTMNSSSAADETNNLSIAQDEEFQKLVRNKLEFNTLANAVKNAATSKEDAAAAANILAANYGTLITVTNILAMSQDKLAIATAAANEQLDKQIRKRASEIVLQEQYEAAYKDAAEIVTLQIAVEEKKADKINNPEKYASNTPNQYPSSTPTAGDKAVYKSSDQIELEKLEYQLEEANVKLSKSYDTINKTQQYIDSLNTTTPPSSSVSINSITKAITAIDEKIYNLDSNAVDYKQKVSALKNEKTALETNLETLRGIIDKNKSNNVSPGGGFTPIESYTNQGENSISDINRTLDEMKAADAQWNEILTFINTTSVDLQNKINTTTNKKEKEQYAQMLSVLKKEKDEIQNLIFNAAKQLEQSNIDIMFDGIDKEIANAEQQYEKRINQLQNEIKDQRIRDLLIENEKTLHLKKLAAIEADYSSREKSTKLGIIETQERIISEIEIKIKKATTIEKMQLAQQELAAEKSKLNAIIGANKIAAGNLRSLWREYNQTGAILSDAVGASFKTAFDIVFGTARQAKDEWDAIWLSFKNTALEAIADIAVEIVKNKIFDLLNQDNKQGGGGIGPKGSSSGGFFSTLFNFAGSVLSIFGLATGGVVQKPILSFVGEAGPEAVIPLHKLSDFIRPPVAPKNKLEITLNHEPGVIKIHGSELSAAIDSYINRRSLR